MELTSFLVQHCLNGEHVRSLLAEYGHNHDSITQGEIGGAHVVIEGDFWRLDDDGEFMILQPVFDGPVPTIAEPVAKPVIIDIIAWHPAKPREWWKYRGEPGLYLGYNALIDAGAWGDPLFVNRTPLSWLKACSKGFCALDGLAVNELIGLSRVICEDAQHGKSLKNIIQKRLSKNVPNVEVKKYAGSANGTAGDSRAAREHCRA